MAKRTITATQAKNNLEPFGYKGPARWSSIDAFVKANPRAKGAVTANEGALIQSKALGFDSGGLTADNADNIVNNSGLTEEEIAIVKETMGAAGNNPNAVKAQLGSVVRAKALGMTFEDAWDSNNGHASAAYGEKLADAYSSNPEFISKVNSSLSDIQYGSVGSNTDTRNIEKIFSSDTVLDTAYAETRDMYSQSGVSAGSTVHQSTGENNAKGAANSTEDGQPAIIKHMVNGKEQLTAIAADGTILTSASGENINAMNLFKRFGLTAADIRDGSINYSALQPTTPDPIPSVPSGGSAGSGQPSGDGGNTVVGTDTPAYTPTTPLYQPVVGGVGTTEVGVPTYETNLQNQRLDFEQRGKAQQSYMQPQTIAEQQAAGTGDFAGKIEQKLFRNRQGLQQYITYIDGKATTPIPQGYEEVPPLVNAYQGGYIQGYQQGGYVTFSSTENRSSGGVGNFVAIMSDGSVVGEGSGLNTHGKAEAAGKAQEQKNKEAYEKEQKEKQNVDVNRPLITGGATLTPEQLQQQQANLSAQTFVNPAGAVTAAPVAYTDPNAAGTVMASTTGQALPTAPIVDENQIAQVDDVTQATTASTMTPVYELNTTTGKMEAKKDAQGNIVYQDTGAKPPVTATGTQTDIKSMTFDPATTDYTSQPVLDENNQPVMEPVLDAQGNPVYEADGTTPKMKPKMQTALSDAATITGQQATGTSVSGVQAAQLGQPILDKDGKPVLDAEGKLTYDTKAQTVQDAPTRILQDKIQKTDKDGNLMFEADGVTPIYEASELVSGSTVDQTKVGEAFGTGEVQAASVQDELSSLMAQFEGGDTPAWAAGSMRKANQMLAARGLSASSMAGQAVIQAAMEAALPIAQIDAGNKQQMALMKAEQRAKFLQIEFDQNFQTKVMNAAKVSEIANMNFNADQQIALENARMAQTVDLANLSNRQAVVMAEAASLAQLDLANLSNLQQAAVQNAQNFLQVDMANLSNAQQMEMFKQQTLANSILTDAAAENAMAQFNATSEQQRDQFMISEANKISQINAAATNAMKQFNANEANAMLKYNSEIQNQREMFNAQQYLVIAQANAKWRQDTQTLNTAAANQSNFEYARQINALTNKAIDQIWQRERDIMGFTFTASESALDRTLKMLLGDKSLEAARIDADATEGASKANLFARAFFGEFGLFGKST